jgi:hypothetical protein
MSKPLSSDTSLEAEKVQMEVLRRMPPWRKAMLVADAWETAKALSLAGLRTRHPEASEAELQRLFVRGVLGEAYPEQASSPAEEMPG